jgi:hypothetical protein
MPTHVPTVSLEQACTQLEALLRIQPRTCAARVVPDPTGQSLQVSHPLAEWLSRGEIPNTFKGWPVRVRTRTKALVS